MSSRISIQQYISPSEPVGAQVGDEWYDSVRGILYKRTLIRGTIGWANTGVSLSDDTTTNSSLFYPIMAQVSASGAYAPSTVSSTKLNFNPSTGTLNATNLNSLSDVNAKEQIHTIESALDKTLALRGVEYILKETKQHQIGVIAQEIEQIIPQVVSTSTDGRKSVSYGNIVGLLIEAIKEQQDQIKELKQTINTLVHKDH